MPGVRQAAAPAVEGRPAYCVRCQGRVVPVTDDFKIGRASTCQLRLSGALISREHARLVLGPRGLVIEDLDSRNGILVNDVPVHSRARLYHGDRVTIGLQTVEIIDEALTDRAEHLSTLPPPSPATMTDHDATREVQLAALSKREREVLELIAQGHTQREIANKLHLSIKTIESHRAHIGDKLGCRTRAELVNLAVLSGMLRNRRP